ncbi:Imm63 family immunity protein [Gordonia sp. CPCC 205515]|uniref:Imm63 family immunity protein n=1 Tax=Gordonia sp. CPCC 205515 TaxID=3140791 RepID=UPI003AF39DC9
MTGPDDRLDADMRARIVVVAQAMSAAPEDLPSLGHIRDDAAPSCWRDVDGAWHLTIRERGEVMFDRHSTDADEYLSWVAVSIAEQASYRLHPPGTDGFQRATWHEQYRLLAAVEQRWADDWLMRTRARLTAAGVDNSVLDDLPAPS